MWAQVVRFWVQVGASFSSFPCFPYNIWAPPGPQSNGYLGSCVWGNVARTWSWSLTSNWCHDQEYVDLYIHSAICFNRVVLNYLSTGTNLPAYSIFMAVLKQMKNYIPDAFSISKQLTEKLMLSLLSSIISHHETHCRNTFPSTDSCIK
jgi:hypothetical protein